MMRRTLCVLLLSFMSSLPASGTAVSPRKRAAVRPSFAILFVGNSLTYTNDLPHLLCGMAIATGKSLECDSLTMGGAALEDHLADGSVQRKLSQRRWAIVAMQQGPSALPESRVDLLKSVRILAPMIREAGGRPALYQVWPSRARSFDFDASCESYRLAAQEVDGLLFPAGRAWQAAWKRKRSLPLYGDDGFHPSVAGSYLAALTIYHQLFGGIPQLLATSEGARHVIGSPLELSESELTILREAAVEAVQAVLATGE